MKVTIKDVIDIISIYAKPGYEILENSKILEDQIIDSINVIQIIAEIEARMNIKISSMDLDFDDFETPLKLVDALRKV